MGRKVLDSVRIGFIANLIGDRNVEVVILRDSFQRGIVDLKEKHITELFSPRYAVLAKIEEIAKNGIVAFDRGTRFFLFFWR